MTEPSRTPPILSVEDLAAAIEGSGSFPDVELVEAVADPRVVDFYLEHSTGHEFVVMLREDRREARVLFEEYVIDVVPVHRVLEFLDLIVRREVALSLNRSRTLLTLRVSLPEGDWADSRTYTDDPTDWERSILDRD
ncbi:hypothetical protein [Kitasatospora sp. NPDC008115]|uniref:hypothetical protein n=1 Tax=Kitasatospora sp. NPDC008115 TaxID=3364022 RepID=UPI0036E89F0A